MSTCRMAAVGTSLAAILVLYGFLPGWRILLLPLFTVMAVLASLGPALLLTALNVKVTVIDQRDRTFVSQDEAGPPYVRIRARWRHSSIYREPPPDLVGGHRRYTVGNDLRVTSGRRGVVWLEGRCLRERRHARHR